VSKNKIIVLQWIPGHCDITGNEETDSLARKSTLITKTRDTEISHCQSHNPKDFQDDERPESGSSIAKILEGLNCKHAWLAKEWGSCKRSSAFWARLPFKTSISNRIISPSLLHTLWSRRRDGRAPFAEMLYFVVNIWKPKTLGGKRSNGCMALSAYPPF
jgi:hypothetical protein